MHCDDFLPLISGHIDQVNTPEEEQALQIHLSSCPTCRRLLRQMEENDRILSRCIAQPPEDLTKRIMKNVRRIPKKKRFNKSALISGLASGLSVAAVMTFIFMVRGLSFGATAAASLEFSPEAAFVQDTISEEEEEYETAQPLQSAANDAKYVPPVSESVVYGFADPDDKSAHAASDGEIIITLPPEQLSDSPDPDSNEAQPPLKRHSLHTGTTAAEYPVLILWNVDSESLSSLSEYEPEPCDSPIFADGSSETTLFFHLSSVVGLPFAQEEEISISSDRNITAYCVPYHLMTSLFDNCIGVCEVSAYYPADFSDYDLCVVFVVQPFAVPDAG